MKKINKLDQKSTSYYKFYEEDNPKGLYDLIKQNTNSLAEDIKTIFSSNKNDGTEIQRNIIARLGQGQYGEGLITYWGGYSVTNYKMVNISL